MKSKFTAQLLLATLALSGIMISTTETSAHSEQQTTFSCGKVGNNFATFAQRGGVRAPNPMIVWTDDGSDYFGRGFTPEARCNEVTDRFNQAVEKNGGRLRNLLLTTGRVNGQTVVCFVNNAERCDDKNNEKYHNVLFTLKPKNASRAGDVLANLLRFSQRASGSAVFESGGGDEENSPSGGQPQSVSLEEVVNKAFDGGNSENSSNVANPSVANPDNAPNSK